MTLPLGALAWLAAALAATIVTRIIRRSRTSVLMEGLVATATSVVAGLLATALDFGGWRFVDWRAVFFAFSMSMAAIAGVRLRRQRDSRRPQTTRDDGGQWSAGPPG